MFRRRRRDDGGTGDTGDTGDELAPADDTTVEDQTGAAEVGAAAPAVGEPGPEAERPTISRPGGAKGPYDAADAPEDDLHRMDFGSLRVPVLEGMEVRFDLDEAGQMAGFVLADGDSVLQLAAFAAPKRTGLWDEVRAEIIASVTESGGAMQETEGPFGAELHATLSTGVPGEQAPARFVGVDQPRWFLRGLLSGPAATDPAAAERLLAVFGETVVQRGTDALPLRDMLAISMPAEVAAAAQQAVQEQADQEAQSQEARNQPSLDRLGPGPTITETR